MAETLDLSMFVQHRDGTAHMDLAVEGVGCAGCIRKIEGGLKRLPGIVEARLNFTNRRLAVDWREDELAAVDVIAALEDIGYRAHPFQPERAETEEAQPRALAGEVPRGRGLRRDEHHAALGVGLVRQRPT